MFPFGDDPSLKRPPFHQLYDQMPKHDDANSPFFSNFPSPFFDEHELPLNQIFPKPPIPKRDPSKGKGKGKAASAAGPRKRTGKKDRHSKICTAQGIRDRRMRLSLQVARKFFDLQDMLGYDKASKTIEWLFTKSKKAIKELAGSASTSDSLASECEVVSGVDENCPNNEVKKSTREAARARARCRTEEKKKRVQESLVLHPPSDAGTIENLLGSSTSASCCLDPTTTAGFMGFLGNWDLLDHRLNYAGNPNSIYSSDFPLFHQSFQA